jgi:hypothetical protein
MTEPGANLADSPTRIAFALATTCATESSRSNNSRWLRGQLASLPNRGESTLPMSCSEFERMISALLESAAPDPRHHRSELVTVLSEARTAQHGLLQGSTVLSAVCPASERQIRGTRLCEGESPLASSPHRDRNGVSDGGSQPDSGVRVITHVPDGPSLTEEQRDRSRILSDSQVGRGSKLGAFLCLKRRSGASFQPCPKNGSGPVDPMMGLVRRPHVFRTYFRKRDDSVGSQRFSGCSSPASQGRQRGDLPLPCKLSGRMIRDARIRKTARHGGNNYAETIERKCGPCGPSTNLRCLDTRRTATSVRSTGPSLNHSRGPISGRRIQKTVRHGGYTCVKCHR